MRTLVFLLLLLGLGAGAFEKAFVIRDVTGRAWGPEVVSYDVKFPKLVKAEELALFNEAGTALPMQFDDTDAIKDGRFIKATVSFLAAVPANGSARYLLRDGQAVKVDAPVTVTKTKGYVELSNGVVALRLAPPASLRNKPAGAVPGPFAGFRAADGTWTGGSTLLTSRMIDTYGAAVTATGPVYAEAVYEYDFIGGGYYRLRVRLAQGAPLAIIDEQFDTPEFSDGRDYLAVSTGANFPTLDDPDQYAYPWKSGDFGKPKDLVGCKFTPVAPWDMFGSRMYYEMNPGNKLGFLVLHSGSWRHPHQAVARLRERAGQPSVLELPFSCYGVLRPWNPFDSAENDAGQPDTYGRRVWGLTLTDGDRKAQRLQYGFIGLDRYKDWVLEWQEPAALKRLAPPYAYVNTGEAAALQASLATNPYKDTLSKLYVINPTDANGANSAKVALGWLDNRLPQGVNTPGSSFRHAQFDDGIVPFCDDALAWPKLPDEQRQALRAKIAAMCYLYMDPDFNPRGLGDHLGNPNMPINRYMGFPQYIQLIKSHPMYQAWLKDAVAYTDWKLADHTSPYGSWREEQGYQQAAVPFILDALLSLNHAGAMTDTMLQHATAIHRYMLAVLSPPDLNAKGLRCCEGTGNGVISHGDSMPAMARLLKEKDPALAATLMWAWTAMGKFPGGHNNHLQSQWLEIDPAIPVRQPAMLPGAFLPGLGATSRADFGLPSETFLFFRQGHNQSHYDMDQGSFKVYAFGEQMLPNSSLGYNDATPAATQHGYITFGDQEWRNNHGRTDSMIVDYAYLAYVDYLCGRQHFDFKSGGEGALKSPVKEPFDWYRQFMTMKSQGAGSPTYFVMRDSFRGKALFTTHWYTWLLGKPEDITVTGNRVTVKTPQGNYLELVFANLDTIKPTFTYKATAGGAGCGFPTTGATLMKLDAQPAGKEYLVVIYPRTAAMPSPQVTSPASGVVQVKTADATDWAFISPDDTTSFKQDTVSFTGRSGAIRLLRDLDVAVLASGEGEVRHDKFGVKGAGPGEGEYEPNKPGVPEVMKLPRLIQFADISVSLEGAPAQAIQPGVSRYGWKDGFAYQFDSPTVLDFNQDGVVFHGRKGMVQVKDKAMRFVMQGDPALSYLARIGYKDFIIRGEGPFDLTFTPAKGDKGGEVTGVAYGRARLLEMPLPQNLVPLNCPQKAFSYDMIPAQNDGPVLTGIAPTLYLNGTQWQVGYYDRGLALPLFDGENKIRITRFYFPPVAPTVPKIAE